MPEPEPLTTSDRSQIVVMLKDIVCQKHVDVRNPGIDYQAWRQMVDHRSHELTSLDDDEAFCTEINGLLSALQSSHTGFFHQSGHTGTESSLHALNASMQATETSSGPRWMFADVIQEGIASRAGIRPGDLMESMDGVAIQPPRPARFKLGSTHQLALVRPGGDKHQVMVEVPRASVPDRPPMVEPPCLSYRMLEPGIGYVQVASFPGTIGTEFAARLDTAVASLKNEGTQSLIIDLRGCCGGGLGSLRLMSYLHPGRLEIGYSVTRERITSGYKKERLARIKRIPQSKAGLMLMGIRFKYFQKDRSVVLVTEKLGPQPFHGKIVMLVNQHSVSGAETVAAFAKERQLATLVGGRTPGMTLGAANFNCPKGYVLRIPVVGWYTWQSQTIEGKGVTPDIVIKNDVESVRKGIDQQLIRAVQFLANREQH